MLEAAVLGGIAGSDADGLCTVFFLFDTTAAAAAASSRGGKGRWRKGRREAGISRAGEDVGDLCVVVCNCDSISHVYEHGLESNGWRLGRGGEVGGGGGGEVEVKAEDGIGTMGYHEGDGAESMLKDINKDLCVVCVRERIRVFLWKGDKTALAFHGQEGAVIPATTQAAAAARRGG